MKDRILIIIACCFFIAYPAHSEIYKWTDKNGQVHYGDKPKDKKSEVVPYKARHEQKSTSESQGSAGKNSEGQNPTTQSSGAQSSATEAAEKMANELKQDRQKKEQEKREREEAKRKKEYRKLCDQALQDQLRLHRELAELDKEQFKKRTAERNEVVKKKAAELAAVSSDRSKYCH